MIKMPAFPGNPNGQAPNQSTLEVSDQRRQGLGQIGRMRRIFVVVRDSESAADIKYRRSIPGLL